MTYFRFPNIPEKVLVVIFCALLLANSVIGILLIHNFSSQKINKTQIEDTNQDAIPSLLPTRVKEKIQLIKKEENYIAVIRDNPQDKTKSDIYLKDEKLGVEEFFITLQDVYKSHYHSAEYHNGNLYILIRPGGEDSYLKNPNWTTELWRYDQQKNGVRLFSNKGIDYRVSDDEQIIAIDAHERFEILDKGGERLSVIKMSDLKTTDKMPDRGFSGFIGFGDDEIWLDTTYGPTLIGLVKIDINTYKIDKYDLTDLDTGPEYAFNMERMLLAFTNYPPIFDEGGREDYLKSAEEVNLVVYNLTTKEKTIIATSTTKRFRPVWVHETTLEYNLPQEEGRGTIQL